MRPVVVVGTGMTRFGRFMDRGLRSLAVESTTEALADGCAAADEVDIIFFGNAAGGLLTGQEMIRGQSALRHTGLLGRALVNVENACASGATAAYMAAMAVASGSAEVAVAVGAEKMTHPDKTVVFRALATGVDREELGLTDPSTMFSFMELYADKARAYLECTGCTVEDLAQVAVKSRRLAAGNHRAQYRERTTVEAVLASRMVASPLTLPMCSPIGDGAAALVFATPEVADRKGVQGVRVRASCITSGSEQSPHAVSRAVTAAYEQAGVGPEDLDVVELHDAAAPAELIGYEELGLCAAGDGPMLLRKGATDLGGRVPVNPSGGLLSKGHPVGATGCAQLVELCDQLRGRGGERQVAKARIALAQNHGGSLGPDSAAAAVTILEAAQ